MRRCESIRNWRTLVILKNLKTNQSFFHLAFIEHQPASGDTKVNESGVHNPCFFRVYKWLNQIISLMNIYVPVGVQLEEWITEEPGLDRAGRGGGISRLSKECGLWTGIWSWRGMDDSRNSTCKPYGGRIKVSLGTKRKTRHSWRTKSLEKWVNWGRSGGQSYIRQVRAWWLFEVSAQQQLGIIQFLIYGKILQMTKTHPFVCQNYLYFLWPLIDKESCSFSFYPF